MAMALNSNAYSSPALFQFHVGPCDDKTDPSERLERVCEKERPKCLFLRRTSRARLVSL